MQLTTKKKKEEEEEKEKEKEKKGGEDKRELARRSVHGRKDLEN